MMQNNNRKYFNKALALSYSHCCCENPVLIRSPHGRLFYVGCGSCPKCLQKRRSAWSRRLVDERYHPLCVHAFGFTLTYDSQSVPYLWFNSLKEGDYDYEDGFKSPHISLLRGCHKNYFKRAVNPAVSLLNFDDIQRLIASYKKWMYENSEYHDFINLDKPKKYLDLPHYKATGEKLYKVVTIKRKKDGNWLWCSYYIAGEYGYSETTSRKQYDFIDPNKLIEKHTSRAHYHGIMYIYAKNKEIYDKLMDDKILLQKIRSQCEMYLLRKWKFAKQRYDSKKGIFVGKSIQEFGKNWGDYLGSYVNKTTLAELARGAQFIPERVVCSHNLGLTWCRKPDNYKRYMKELAMAVKCGGRFNPTVLKDDDDDMEKYLPRRYKLFYIQQYFHIKIGDYCKWVRQENYKNHQLPDALYRFNVPFKPFGFPASEFVFKPSWHKWLNPIQGYYTFTNYLKTVTINKKFITDKKKLERYSIYRCPNDKTYNINEYVKFTKNEVRRFTKFRDFLRSQTDLFLDELCFGYSSDDDFSYSLDEYGLVFSPMADDETDFILSFCNDTLSVNREKCVNVRKFAMDKKRIHERRNNYNE